MFNRTAYNDKEWIKVTEGKLCPNSDCKSKDIKCVGGANDGINMNLAFDCNTCKTEWEGK